MKKRKIISISAFVLGIAALVAGITFLVLNIIKSNHAADADYLVSAENWTLQDSDSVVWDFTEISKGTLTTNNHENDYDFIWSLEDGKLKVETDWLYDLDNEFSYTLDQSAGTLTLTDNDGEYVFVANFDK